jgi:hypothetical protein
MALDAELNNNHRDTLRMRRMLSGAGVTAEDGHGS